MAAALRDVTTNRPCRKARIRVHAAVGALSLAMLVLASIFPGEGHEQAAPAPSLVEETLVCDEAKRGESPASDRGPNGVQSPPTSGSHPGVFERLRQGDSGASPFPGIWLDRLVLDLLEAESLAGRKLLFLHPFAPEIRAEAQELWEFVQNASASEIGELYASANFPLRVTLLLAVGAGDSAGGAAFLIDRIAARDPFSREVLPFVFAALGLHSKIESNSWMLQQKLILPYMQMRLTSFDYVDTLVFAYPPVEFFLSLKPWPREQVGDFAALQLWRRDAERFASARAGDLYFAIQAMERWPSLDDYERRTIAEAVQTARGSRVGEPLLALLQRCADERVWLAALKALWASGRLELGHTLDAALRNKEVPPFQKVRVMSNALQADWLPEKRRAELRGALERWVLSEELPPLLARAARALAGSW